MAHAPQGTIQRPVYSSFSVELIRNVLIALSVSFVALSLGAAFGILSGRGAFYGMFAAGIIAFVCAVLGGTRVQCSGPTAPMAAIMAGIMTMAQAKIAADPASLGGMTADHFVNFTILLCGLFMILMAVFRTGKLIAYVPDSVISGFMTGIGLIIWVGQMKTLFAIGHEPLAGGLGWNALVAAGTVALTFFATPIMAFVSKPVAKIIPGTLFALLAMVGVSLLFKLPVERIVLDANLKGWDDLKTILMLNIPRHITWEAFNQAWFYGFQFALISYLDSLMVALIIDRLTGEKTKLNKELFAQGTANALVSLVGGVPGTQASMRSVMMIQEGATMRLAGILVGVFAIIGMMLCQDYLELIPQAVFMGILLKVGWNIIDKEPIVNFFKHKKQADTALDFVIIVGTALVTVYNLALAVVLFTALYYIVNHVRKTRHTPHAPVAEQLLPALEDIEKTSK